MPQDAPQPPKPIVKPSQPLPLPSFDQLRALVLQYPQARFETPDEAAIFEVRDTAHGLVFIPAKSKSRGPASERQADTRKITAVLQALAQRQEREPDQARQPGQYATISHNASYILGLVQAWEEEQDGAFCPPEHRTQPGRLSPQQQDALWEQVRQAMRPRAKTHAPGGRITHGFELESTHAVIAKLKWLATVYWSDNLPANDVEVAFKLSRLEYPGSDTRAMRAWFDQTCQRLQAHTARRHASQERADFRAGFTTATAMEFFQLLGQQLSPSTPRHTVWAVPAPAPAPAPAKVDDGRAGWEWAIEAVKALGEATREEVQQWIFERKANYDTVNARMDLNTVTVNYWGRGGYPSYNGKPRRSDAGNPLDALYAEDGMYRAYDAAQHGIWELQAFDSGEWDKPGVPEPLRPILVESPATMAVARVERDALDAGRFDATDDTDAREKGMATVVLRRGQPQFRAALLEAYAGCCAISGCDVAHTLEAAHITPHLGRHTDVVCNGLLLRADLHTLFDLGLLWIDPVSLKVQLHSSLSRSSYADLHGAALRPPAHVHQTPDRQALRTHIRRVVREVQKRSGER